MYGGGAVRSILNASLTRPLKRGLQHAILEPDMYKRVLLKLSGEALAAGRGFGIDAVFIHKIAEEIAAAHALGCQIGIVVGGGNFFRGVAQPLCNAWHAYKRGELDLALRWADLVEADDWRLAAVQWLTARKDRREKEVSGGV